ANLFLHYAFDVWMAREFPEVTFERYVDDAVVHCSTRRQAQAVLAAIAERMGKWGCGYIPRRRGSCTARTTTVGAVTSTRLLHSWGSRSGNGGHAPGRECCSIPSSPPSARKP